MLLELIELPDLAPSYRAAPRRWFRPSWMYCSVRNSADEPIFIYGPRHDSAKTAIPTSLYVLYPGQRTPRFWDCKGILIPLGRTVRIKGETIRGPVALKFRDMRRITVRQDSGQLICSRPNHILRREQDHFPVPGLTDEEISRLPRQLVSLGR